MRRRFPLGRGVWHKNGVMTPAEPRKERPSARSRTQLEELALRYVERFATTRAKLRDYLAPQAARARLERGARARSRSASPSEFAELGYVDDAAYALAKSRSLTGRGYGKRRLVAEVARRRRRRRRTARTPATLADEEAVSSALRFAERRRLGPFAATRAGDPRDREKALAAMVRAGHGFALARAIVELAPGAEVDPDELRERAADR